MAVLSKEKLQLAQEVVQLTWEATPEATQQPVSQNAIFKEYFSDINVRTGGSNARGQQTGRSNAVDLTSPPPTLPPQSPPARRPQAPSYDLSEPQIAAGARDLQAVALGSSEA
ncbi:hypothetical protein LTR10_023639 [Elasticomyces elasticus]|uniref:Uncharacterized protein n=1 Tax=Exophiala sideris TaxID=1016849 RepID=A0ABR0IUU9_9EURO|nr:hypothetical protein LTR10_023639 [Elasticomyces elasticus]KAK5020942.1 hypothetical protein LTS07_011351 [Exophiala sideris]KAK5025448.1 hypothetical protein LTR13_010525 [Exophiala sideris]KAK5048437.1 hypothetical protein LTR69_011376 [Exophiala sideris]KAK5176972.1 hypothetical protein LTR44_010545 [Eurotiomycetes sp. CCFEE 6388]